MQVILKEDFIQLGYVGDVVNVAPGYARNFLIPRGICLELSSVNAKVLKHQQKIIAAKKAKKKVEAEKVANDLKDLILEFTLVFGRSGKSFGSVSAKEIQKALSDKGHSIDKKQLKFESIKTLGEHIVSVVLHSEVSAEIKVRVFPDPSSKIAKKENVEEEVTEPESESDLN